MTEWKQGDSAPFLMLSRRLGVPYANVLRYAQYLTAGVGLRDDELTDEQQKAVFKVWYIERARRRHVRRQTKEAGQTVASEGVGRREGVGRSTIVEEATIPD